MFGAVVLAKSLILFSHDQILLLHIDCDFLFFLFPQKVSSDPFKDCHAPTVFAVGSEGRVSSVAYVEVRMCLHACIAYTDVSGCGADI